MPEPDDLSALEPREPETAPAAPAAPAAPPPAAGPGGPLSRLAAAGGVRLKLAVRFILIMIFALVLMNAVKRGSGSLTDRSHRWLCRLVSLLSGSAPASLGRPFQREKL